MFCYLCGGIAQSVERLLCKQNVIGSNPVTSTTLDMNEKNEKKYYKRQVEHHNQKKALLVEYKGGKCCICGYKKHNGALDFHHVGPKKFAIGSQRSLCMDKLKKEADQTVLVCKNCHAEIHGGIHKRYNK